MELTNPLRDLGAYRELDQCLKEGIFPIACYGISTNALGYVMGALKEDVSRPLLFITYDELKAKSIYEDLCSLGFSQVGYLPRKELFLFDRQAASRERWRQRLEVYRGLQEGRLRLVITTIEALRDKTLAHHLRGQSITLRLGESVFLDKLFENLVAMGYERVNQVDGMGQWAYRGGILDVFGEEENPWRIEFFDDEVDSLRTFSAQSQRSMENLEEISISPVKEFFIPKARRDAIAKALEKDLKATKEDERGRRLREKFTPILEALEENGSIQNYDLLIPYLEKEVETVLDFYDQAPIVFLDEPRRIEETSLERRKKEAEEFAELLQFGEVFSSHAEARKTPEEIDGWIRSQDVVIFNSIIKGLQGFEVRAICNFHLKGVGSFRGRMEAFTEELRAYLKRNYRIILLAGSRERGEKLLEHLTSLGFSPSFLSTTPAAAGIFIAKGSLHEGFEIPDAHLVLMHHGEIYGHRSTKKKRRKAKPSLNFEDLQIGDYVVHETHGVGQYLGTDQIEIQGSRRDFITIAYRGTDRLFLPVDQLHLIHKYIGNDAVAPKVARLNSLEWNKTKQKAKKSVEDMAEDLIRLYAKRQHKEGYAFSKDDAWQQEFEDAFIYEETEGQLQSTEEIKKDMERPRPMDRLLCADVGYGKTEVALRAAFKAVLDGKQVAFLVPTTILAQQHYATMVERFRDFPVDIAVLSRFRTKKEQAEDLKRLKEGNLDIIVGTHRLLSKDVKFHDLGLLIIDEEQRFGVRHKESLKLLKETVDTLTLTATPIPRTLQMSMVGIRDMSVIDEPPEERFPIQTTVTEYHPLMVRDAILREVERGGQVYFVSNRVAQMDLIMKELEELVPEARFAMAHGQMTERALEDVMFAFVNREVDVLICSTIIETGLDVANANTMLITDSQRLGLSQLYQLRGRIGRSSRLAYAYFTYPKDVAMTEIAEKRLRAIKEFTEFGSGYKIAMRDLEIRGSGNILGARQSGHLHAIGYDLYIKYLRQAILKLHGIKEEEEVPTQIDVRIDAFIPPSYVEEEKTRLELYKKISVIENEEDERDLIDELIDRFGTPPESISNLIDLALIRSWASKVRVVHVTQKFDNYQLNLLEGEEIRLALMNELTKTFGNRVEFGRKNPGYIRLYSPKHPLYELKELLRIMGRDRSEQ